MDVGGVHDLIIEVGPDLNKLSLIRPLPYPESLILLLFENQPHETRLNSVQHVPEEVPRRDVIVLVVGEVVMRSGNFSKADL